MPLDFICPVIADRRRAQLDVPRQDLRIWRGDDDVLQLTIYADDYAAVPLDVAGAQAILSLFRRGHHHGGWGYGDAFLSDYGTGWKWEGWGTPCAQFRGYAVDLDTADGRIDIPLPAIATECLRGRYDYTLSLSLDGMLPWVVQCGVVDVLRCPNPALRFSTLSISATGFAQSANPAAFLPDPGGMVPYGAAPLAGYDVAVFTVSAVGEGPRPARVNWTTMDGEGAAGLDYTASSGTLLIGVGATSNVIQVPTRPLTPDYRASDFRVVISNPFACTIAVGSALMHLPGAFVLDYSVLDGPDMLAGPATSTGPSGPGIFTLDQSLLGGPDTLA